MHPLRVHPRHKPTQWYPRGCYRVLSPQGKVTVVLQAGSFLGEKTAARMEYYWHNDSDLQPTQASPPIPRHLLQLLHTLSLRFIWDSVAHSVFNPTWQGLWSASIKILTNQRINAHCGLTASFSKWYRHCNIQEAMANYWICLLLVNHRQLSKVGSCCNVI